MLVRATATLRLFEEALEEQGLPTYVVGGRGYWSQEQVRDGLAWLRVLANPHDEDALLNVLASPFHGASTDELILLAEEGRKRGSLWEAVQDRGGEIAQLLATERALAERTPLEVLLERAIVATGYDLAVLARPGGDRRLANLRKLMRLAGEFERAEGRDLRGFLADAAARDLAEAREGEAALESDGLDAIRLMTIHRAKGLEFPVVCVADLGRASGARRAALLVGPDRRGGPATRAARRRRHDPHPHLGAPRRGRGQRRRRGGTPPLLRRDDPRPRAADPVRRHRHEQVAGPAQRRPADRLDRPRPDQPPARQGTIEREWDGRPARIAVALNTPETLPDEALQRASPGPASRARPRSRPSPPSSSRPRSRRGPCRSGSPTPRSATTASAATASTSGGCWQLPDVEPPPPEPGAEPPSLDPRTRGSIVHALLEDLDFADPQLPELTNPRPHRGAEGGHPPARAARSPAARCAPASPTPSRSPARPSSASRWSPTAQARWSAASSTCSRSSRTAPSWSSTTRRTSSATIPTTTSPATTRRSGSSTRWRRCRDGAPRVEVAYCLLDHDPETPVTRTYTQADAPDLADEINRLATGILTHAYPVTPTPHRELCGDCPGRAKLCCYGPDETLRPPPAPWPGVPVRHMSPAGT